MTIYKVQIPMWNAYYFSNVESAKEFGEKYAAAGYETYTIEEISVRS